MTKKIKIIVGIPAYNEEKNIEHILGDVFEQKLPKNCKVDQAIVYSDGSTDKTNTLIKRFSKKHPRTKLVIGRGRKGKNGGLNYFFSHCNDVDILILLDADIKMIGDMVFDAMISVLVNDKHAQVVSAHQTPVRPDNFEGKIIYASNTLWDYVRWSIPDYDHVQNLYSGATAIRGSLAKTMHIPKGAGDERIYIYQKAKNLEGFRYCRSAHVLYMLPTTISEFLSLRRRKFGTRVDVLEKEFGDEISISHIVSWKYKLIGILKSFWYQPIYTPIALVFGYIIGNIRPDDSKIVKSDIWERTESAKNSF